MPFFALAMSQMAASHLSRPSGLSSMIVPTLTLNCFLHALHFHNRRVERKLTSFPEQTGQVTPSGQRSGIRNWRQVSGSEKYRTASVNVLGVGSLASMTPFYPEPAGESSI